MKYFYKFYKKPERNLKIWQNITTTMYDIWFVVMSSKTIILYANYFLLFDLTTKKWALDRLLSCLKRHSFLLPTNYIIIIHKLITSFYITLSSEVCHHWTVNTLMRMRILYIHVCELNELATGADCTLSATPAPPLPHTHNTKILAL